MLTKTCPITTKVELCKLKYFSLQGLNLKSATFREHTTVHLIQRENNQTVLHQSDIVVMQMLETGTTKIVLHQSDIVVIFWICNTRVTLSSQ